jgi:hypothetical protein
MGGIRFLSFFEPRGFGLVCLAAVGTAEFFLAEAITA